MSPFFRFRLASSLMVLGSLFVALTASSAAGAAHGNGKVAAHQKISAAAGGFGGALEHGDKFGTSVAAIGDRDGDGVGDIAVGAPHDSDGAFHAGAVWIVLLNSDGTVKGQHEISAIAGGFGGQLDADDSFGRAVTALGDLDGNGATDLAVGAPGDDDGEEDAGAVWILFLDQAGMVMGEQKISNLAGGLGDVLDEDVYFGWSVASIGDLDGDGIEEIIVGAPWEGDFNWRRGAVRVLFLNADGTVRAAQEIDDWTGGLGPVLANYDLFGISAAPLGDLDGDGILDVAVGAEHDQDGGPFTGAIYVLFLQTDGSVRAHQKISATSGGLSAPIGDGEHFSGGGIANLGDVDGDGIVDLAVGQYSYPDEPTSDELFGTVWILFLRADGTVKAFQEIDRTYGTLSGAIDRPWGVGVGALGDLNGDGILDLAAGAYDQDDSGALWVLFGDGAPSARCGAAPRIDCLATTKSKLKLKVRPGDDRGDQLVWKWRATEPTVPDLRDPTTGAEYSLCVWDTAASTPVHVASLDVASGAGWTSASGKFKYKDKLGLQSGVTKVAIAATPADAQRVSLKARGLRLPMPVPVSASAFFTRDPKVITQLVGSAGDCLAAEFGTSKVNSGTIFKAP